MKNIGSREKDKKRKRGRQIKCKRGDRQIDKMVGRGGEKDS